MKPWVYITLFRSITMLCETDNILQIFSTSIWIMLCCPKRVPCVYHVLDLRIFSNFMRWRKEVPKTFTWLFKIGYNSQRALGRKFSQRRIKTTVLSLVEGLYGQLYYLHFPPCSECINHAHDMENYSIPNVVIPTKTHMTQKDSTHFLNLPSPSSKSSASSSS